MKRLIASKLDRFQNLISSAENDLLTDFLIDRHAIIDVLENEYQDFIAFLKEYQEQFDFTDHEKDSIRISLIRYLSIAIKEGLNYDELYDLFR